MPHGLPYVQWTWCGQQLRNEGLGRHWPRRPHVITGATGCADHSLVCSAVVGGAMSASNGGSEPPAMLAVLQDLDNVPGALNDEHTAAFFAQFNLEHLFRWACRLHL
eukprot:365895-Chlamydomonas_euryale.AAC.4